MSASLAFIDYTQPLGVQMEEKMIDDINAKNLQESIDNAVALQKALGDFNVEIAQARQQFWALYPDKPGFAAAKKRLSTDLFTKDMEYLGMPAPVRFLIGIGDTQIDGGIPAVAKVQFNFWAKSVRDKCMGANDLDHTSLGDLIKMPGKLAAALVGSERYYQAYVIQRDWAEFDAAGVAPGGSDPTLYGILLCSRYEKEAPDEAAVEYKAMEDILGSENVRAAMAKVREAPKDKHGNIANMDALGLVEVQETDIVGPSGPTNQPDNSVLAPAGKIPIYGHEPLQAAVALATQSDPHLYVLSFLASNSPALHLKNAHNQTEYGALTNYTYDWPYAKATYDQWTAAYGADAVQSAAQKVQSAPRKLGDGGVADLSKPRYGGVDSFEAFKNLLHSDKKNYIRSILALNAPNDPPAAVDAAYQKLVSTYGESAVEEAGVTLDYMQASRSIPAGITTDYDALMAILNGTIKIAETPKAPEKPQIDNPKYLAWKNCKPGTKVTFLNSSWDQLNTQTQLDFPYLQETRTLRSVDDSVALFWNTVTSIFPQGANPSHDEEAGERSKIDVDNSMVQLASGAETLSIHGQDVFCHWVKKTGGAHDYKGAEVTVWTSDQVPGGFIRSLDMTPNAWNHQEKSCRETIVLSFDPVTTSASGSVTPTTDEEKITRSGLLGYVSPVLRRKSLAPAALASIEDIPTPNLAPATPAALQNRPVAQDNSVLPPGEPALAASARPSLNGPLIPLANLNGKTTGSADLDVRIIRVYNSPQTDKLPRSTALLIRQSIFSRLYQPKKLTPADGVSLRNDCILLEEGPEALAEQLRLRQHATTR